ncbi:glutamate synthase large subunit [Aestuariivirga sp.]|uniref:glutamate synthase large subunit n=1 Tax=Aestuariivirga sp. TaxID=2650926 RepID=UPI0039E5646A
MNMMKRPEGLPEAHGLYDPRNEHDACGIGLVANIHNVKAHRLVSDGLSILKNLEHRGAVGADPKAGDGAGIMIQIPHAFFAAEAKRLGFELPGPQHYGVAQLFMPREPVYRQDIERIWWETSREEGLKVLGWRDAPVDSSILGYSVKGTEPVHRQLFIGRGPTIRDEAHFERKLFVCRKVVSNRVLEVLGSKGKTYYPVSVSARTIVYKGLVLGKDLGAYYRDLEDPLVESAFAMVHQRFSTNTFPSWPLSHPYRFVCHNGEINTVRGNYNWMAARQANMKSDILGEDLSKLWPISYEGQSDTACFDNALEFLHMGGYSLPHAMMMLIPEAWAGNPLMDEDRRAFYEYHAALMEPWDGPAAMVFTDGRLIGATLDRNGLRPSRYMTTDDGYILLASEMGCLQFAEEHVTHKWRLQPGKMLLIDLEQKRMISDEELKKTLATAHPYKDWLKRTQVVLKDLPQARTKRARSTVPLLDRQQAFGYTQEDLKILMAPMAQTGQEAVGSMGNDAPISALSDKAKLLDTYFKQNFAQVTNPPIDPIREELVMSLVSFIGPRPNLLDLKGTSKHMRLEVAQPILTNEDLERVRTIGAVSDNPFRTATIDITYDVANGPEYMEAALDSVCGLAERAVKDGYNIIILSDRAVSAERVPIPALLATSATHHHLIRKGLRTAVGLVVESGEPREVHQFAALAGYGAEAVNPYLAFETLEAMLPQLEEEVTAYEAGKRFIKAIDKGLLKVMSKMGISTYQSYCGAQIFDAVGLSSEFVRKYFTGTATQIEGVGLSEIAAEAFRRHEDAFGENPVFRASLDVGGEYAQRMRGEAHVWTAETVSNLQHAVRGNSRDKFRNYARLINEQSERLKTMRGLFRIRTAEEMGRAPVDIEEVEPTVSIVRRFATGAMSYGSISREAHTTLAIAMNRIGGRSNTGEGGEEADRFKPLANGDSMRSAIKQVASGRFGVTAEYLVNSDMMQIKMAQGAKPGEGGQLPGHKVDATIAKVRHSTPGVGLISPPPHHDIYSIEDLAQLIFDLKNVNPAGLVSVKLVSEVGVGTVAAGVSKAHADHVTISGYEGGTGASPLTSIKHAGSPWEIGLAETQQTLVANDLRGRITVQADGGIRTGRDVVIAALLGADEIGFATAPLIAAGCIMMRKCHLNTCPVGVATQDPVLRKRFTGQPEHVINFFFFVAEEVREHLAAMGMRSYDELIGETQWLDQQEAIAHWKAKGLDFSRIFAKPDVTGPLAIKHVTAQDHGIDRILDRKLIAEAAPALEHGKAVEIATLIRNADRTAGAMLAGAVAQRYGHEGLPDDTIRVSFNGIAGQSFGAWAAHGMTLTLTGEANDYVGKGLSGGRLVVRPQENIGFVPEKSIIVGNTVLYGAITGECYFRGVAGERFAVRNSGAIAVVEGVGDHGCEYMTGGCVLVIGETGRNFAAGMSGGVAYVLDEAGDFAQRCNLAMVDLQPVPEEEDTLERLHHHGGDLEGHGLVDVTAHMDRHDAERVRELLTRHVKYTGSSRAQAILDNWQAMLAKFVKVMPVEYARALQELEKAQETSDGMTIGLKRSA